MQLAEVYRVGRALAPGADTIMLVEAAHEKH
jgi:hypothetical protein